MSGPAPEWERVLEEDGGRQLACRMTETCQYRTHVWWTDDGSAEEEFDQHKNRVHRSRKETGSE